MPSERSRFLRYLGGCACVIAALELCAIAAEPYLRGASHRAFYKDALLASRTDAAVAFIGSSRMHYGIAPRVFSRCLGMNVKALNLASYPTRLQIFEHTAHSAARSPSLRLVFLEVSRPVLNDATPDWPTDLLGGEPARDAEEWLAQKLRLHSAAVRYHRAFQLDSLLQAASLLFLGGVADGSERYGADFLNAWSGQEPVLHGEEAHALEPIVVEAADAPEGEMTKDAARLTAVVAELQRAGKVVVLVEPPLQNGEDGVTSLATTVARARGISAWRFAANPLPADHFEDPTHVSARGKHDFSCALGRAAQVRLADAVQ